MIVLGIDLGGEGAAVMILSRAGEIKTWLWNTKKLPRVERQVLLAKQFKEILKDTWPDMVMYERPFARGMHATRSLWGMAGITESIFGKVAAVLDVTPSEIKKFATGSGKAEKAEMIDAAARRGYHAKTEHAADAYHAALYALHHHKIGD